MSDLETAIERLHEVDTEGRADFVYGVTIKHKAMIRDLWTVFDATFKRDDGEAVTEEWLKAVGFKAVPSDMGPNYYDHYENGLLNIWQFNGKEWLMNGADWFDINTRGQLRKLCSVIGIPLKDHT